MSLVFIVGVDRYPDQCVVQRVDLDNGKFLMPRTFKENRYNWVGDVINLIAKEMPQQVIFDEYGTGAAIKDSLIKELRGMIADNGIVSY